MRSPNRLVAKHYPWLIRDRRHVRKRVIAVRGCATPEQPASGAGHAIRGELQDLASLIQLVGDERYKQALGLCQIPAAYIAVDVSGRWPTDADVHEIERLVSERGTEIKLDEAEVYDYLSGAALGFRPLTEVFGDDVAAVTCRS
jgi:hypothetical protein